MRNYKSIFTVILWGLLLLSCSLTKTTDSVKLSPEEKTEVSQAVIAWLECEECDDGELNALKKYGKLAVPTLIATLAKGPSPASLELMRRGLEVRYNNLVEYAKSHRNIKVAQSKDDFVAHYMNNYVALYQIRSALGLAAIGGKEAGEALQRASRTPYRSDVLEVIKEQLTLMRK